MTTHTLQTARLRLRRLDLSDAAFIRELLNSPGFLTQIGDRGVRTLEDAQRYIVDGPHLSVARHGYALDLVETLTDRRPIGICGLVRRDSLDGPDLGYAFLPDVQGEGFATEAGLAVLDHAWSTSDVSRVWAVVKPGNEGSVAVLRRLGFAAQGRVVLPTHAQESLLFAADRPTPRLSKS